MRVFGVIQIQGAMYDSFSEQGNVAEMVAKNVYTDCMNKLRLRTTGGVRQIARSTKWTALFQKGIQSGKAVGTVGLSLQYTGSLQTQQQHTDWNNLVTAMEQYWKGFKYTVTIETVQDAFSVGNPVQVAPCNRLRRRNANACTNPTDIRSQFTNDKPALPDSSASC